MDEKEVRMGNRNNGCAADQYWLIHLISGWTGRCLWQRVRKHPAGEANIVNVSENLLQPAGWESTVIKELLKQPSVTQFCLSKQFLRNTWLQV